MQPQPTATVRDAVNGRLATTAREPLAEQRSSYHQPSRWATPARRRTDVYVVELARSTPTDPTDEDRLLLTA